MVRNRLELLKRRNAGLEAKQRLEQRLFGEGCLPEEHCHFLDLERSDEVVELGKASFMPRNKGTAQAIAGRIPFGFGRQLAICSLQTTPPIPNKSAKVYVVFLDSDKTGVVEMPASVFCDHWMDLVEIDPDGFSVLEQGFRNKLVVQVVGRETEGDTLDIGVWGDEWSEAVAGMTNLGG